MVSPDARTQSENPMSDSTPSDLNEKIARKSKTVENHPAGKIKYGGVVQAARMSISAIWLFSSIFSIAFTQYFGAPLYLINRDYYYAFMALTKQSFGLLIITFTQWFSPTVVRVSGDQSVRGQLLRTKDGRLQTNFPERLVMIANHQLYSDWLYLWWIAYANRMHGHVYIILKESLKYIPILGQGMMFYSFVFMARNWARDKPRLQHRLQQLKGQHQGPLSGTQALDPMWLMIYPEGTNLSANGRNASRKWADKQGLQDFDHLLIPRSTGLQYCLQELKGTVDWVYDCTVAYEGIPRGSYGQDIFTLHSTYLQGRPPKSVNMYWRRFAVSTIPLDDVQRFELWLRQRWLEKESLLEGYVQTGRFPGDEGYDIDDKPVINGNSNSKNIHGAGIIETEVKLGHWYEIVQIFVVLLTFALVANVLVKVWNLFNYGTLVGKG